MLGASLPFFINDCHSLLGITKKNGRVGPSAVSLGPRAYRMPLLSLAQTKASSFNINIPCYLFSIQ
ncbi:MAG: hypothetical protein ACK5QU_06445, partial [Bacteroidota bacterium]